MDVIVKDRTDQLFVPPQVYEQEVTETKKRKQVEISELDGRLQVEYEAKLTEALKDLRDQYEEQLRNNRTEVEYLYETKVKWLTFVHLQLLFFSYSVSVIFWQVIF